MNMSDDDDDKHFSYQNDANKYAANEKELFQEVRIKEIIDVIEKRYTVNYPTYLIYAQFYLVALIFIAFVIAIEAGYSKRSFWEFISNLSSSFTVVSTFVCSGVFVWRFSNK
jgi:hypothetical protein